jgi:CRISPR-associated protein Cas4
MLSVTDLTSFMYCPARLYAKKKLGYKQPWTIEMLRGSVIHDVLEVITKTERSLLEKTDRVHSKIELIEVYRRRYAKDISKRILVKRRELEKLDVKPMDFFTQVMTSINCFLDRQASQIAGIMETRSRFGSDLLEILPKKTAEASLSSETLGLKGRVDCIEDSPTKLTIVEYKTGRPPEESVWEDHKIQIAAYALLLEEQNTKTSYGAIEYVNHGRREVYINPFLKLKVKSLVKEINILLEKDSLPDGCGKCSWCKSE